MGLLSLLVTGTFFAFSLSASEASISTMLQSPPALTAPPLLPALRDKRKAEPSTIQNTIRLNTVGTGTPSPAPTKNPPPSNFPTPATSPGAATETTTSCPPNPCQRCLPARCCQPNDSRACAMQSSGARCVPSASPCDSNNIPYPARCAEYGDTGSWSTYCGGSPRLPSPCPARRCPLEGGGDYPPALPPPPPLPVGWPVTDSAAKPRVDNSKPVSSTTAASFLSALTLVLYMLL